MQDVENKVLLWALCILSWGLFNSVSLYVLPGKSITWVNVALKSALVLAEEPTLVKSKGVPLNSLDCFSLEINLFT